MGADGCVEGYYVYDAGCREDAAIALIEAEEGNFPTFFGDDAASEFAVEDDDCAEAICTGAMEDLVFAEGLYLGVLNDLGFFDLRKVIPKRKGFKDGFLLHIGVFVIKRFKHGLIPLF